MEEMEYIHRRSLKIRSNIISLKKSKDGGKM